MMWESSDIIGFEIRATDGSIGSIDDLLVDETDWSVRWVVIDTGTWLPGRKVLLPASCFGAPSMPDRQFPIELSRQQVEDSPDIDTDAPVSRQMESDIYGYYGWHPYWGAGYVPVGTIGYVPPISAAGTALPPLGVGTPETARAEAMDEPRGDPHLRSAKEITGYRVRGTDDDIGTVSKLLVDQEGWMIRYLVVDTGNWLPGKKVLVSPGWVEDVS
jgi:hypothetical protein